MTNWLPPVAPVPEPPAPPALSPAAEPSRARRLLGPLFVAGLVVLKFGAKLKGLLLLLPKLKVLTTSASMLVSVAAYAVIWGWRFAVGFVALLFLHEMGHVVQMKREGVKVSGMLFIPFLGAAVGARSMGGNALAEARIGLAGPILGTLATAALIPLAEAQNSDFLRALAFTGFFLNLFNLAPVVPLDGGRAMAAMAPWMWFAGFAAMLGFFVLFPNPILVLILLLGGMETWRRWKTRKQGLEGNEAYYRVRPVHRLLVAMVYVGLIAACAVGMDLTFVDRSDAI
jgi:Zn-dependent protease